MSHYRIRQSSTSPEEQQNIRDQPTSLDIPLRDGRHISLKVQTGKTVTFEMNSCGITETFKVSVEDNEVGAETTSQSGFLTYGNLDELPEEGMIAFNVNNSEIDVMSPTNEEYPEFVPYSPEHNHRFIEMKPILTNINIPKASWEATPEIIEVCDDEVPATPEPVVKNQKRRRKTKRFTPKKQAKKRFSEEDEQQKKEKGKINRLRQHIRKTGQWHLIKQLPHMQ